MPKVAQSFKNLVSKCSAARANQHAQPTRTSALRDIENTPPPRPKARRTTRSQPARPTTPLAELDKLRSELAALQDENSALRDTSAEQARQLDLTVSELRSAKETLTKVRQAKRELSAQKRSLDDQLKEEQKRRTRIKRDKRKQERKREEEHVELMEAQELRHTEESATTVAFNASQRMHKNGTEKFIDKVITPGLETWVIRNGRTIFAKQQAGEFRRRVAADYREKVDTHDQQAAKKVAGEKERLERLAAVGMVTDVAAIEGMTLAKLREQLEIHKDILKDPVLTDKKQFKWGMVKGLLPRRLAVLAALERYRLASPGVLKAAEKSVLLPSPMEVDEGSSSMHSAVEIGSEDDMMDDEFF
ncbi:hypothetical protein EV122DRAFT_290858 [Schizophyllum commune]